MIVFSRIVIFIFSSVALIQYFIPTKKPYKALAF